MASGAADDDVLLAPSATREAPAGIDWVGDPVFNAPWTLMHLPVVNVPGHVGPNGTLILCIPWR